MTKQGAIKTIWDYMLMGHKLKEADLIVVLGSHDIRTAEYAAQLWKDGWAPYLVCSGSGTVHKSNPAWDEFNGRPEAEVFAEIAIEAGVSKDKVLVENQSQNTGDNFKFTKKLLDEKGIDFHKVILVQKPFMERRTYAIAKVQWPDKETLVTAPPMSVEEYSLGLEGEWWIHAMVGDLQRIKEYPKMGFQIEQLIPDDAWGAYEYLVGLGYTDYLIK